MPTILIWRGYRFHFYSNENGEPPHVHVDKDGCQAKFWLKDCSLAYNDDFKHNEIRKIHEIVKNNKAMFLEKWNEYCERKN